ncbi:MAG: MarR family winged helix-turn-helix transcriptional regulator [Devosia sp.]|nr:MarR family winged helix-turn-helix transcriptional regulator [Devosia sp.]
MQVDFTTCLVFNTRLAARAVTRRYDGLLRPYGITSAQFSLLGGLKRGEGRTVTDIAERNGIDRTSLTRNLDRLEKMGLITSRAAEKGNARLCDLTAEGEALVGQLVPIWVEAQTEMRELLSADDFSTTLTVLKRLSRA